MERRTRVGLAIGLCSLLGLSAVPAEARQGWRAAAKRLSSTVEAELGLARQAVGLEQAMAAVEREQAGAEYSAAMLDHAGRESLRRLDAYRSGRDVRERKTRQRARAMYKAARGGIARLAFEDMGNDDPTGADRVARGRDLRWLVRHDLHELAAYQRAERRAATELLSAHRQLQALSALATVHGVQDELLTTARAATGPALVRARKARRKLLASMPPDARARTVERKRLRELKAGWKELRAIQRTGGDDTLVRPVRGKLAGGFGEYTDPVLRLPMVRNGVELAARRDEAVRAPGDGRVVMVAAIPGFDQVVVIDHGGGELCMLGRLWKVSVSEGEQVEAGDTIASVAPKAVDDGLGTTAYVELRHGDKPVDPAPRLGRATRRR